MKVLKRILQQVQKKNYSHRYNHRIFKKKKITAEFAKKLFKIMIGIAGDLKFFCMDFSKRFAKNSLKELPTEFQKEYLRI